MKLAIITPVSHLPGLRSKIDKLGSAYYLEDNPDKSEVRALLLEEGINTIICNPNQQAFKIDHELLDQTEVNLINTCSTGLNHIDMEYCETNDIAVYSLKNDMDLIEQLPSTAELSFGLMMAMLRRIPTGMNHVAEYKWDYTQFMGRQIKDLKIGVIGYGRLGKMMYHYCKAFGAEVFVNDPYIDGIEQTSLEYMARNCDVISLHVHVTPETKHMINGELLNDSKSDLIIVNTSRGEIVHEQDLVQLIKSGKVSGYATDVITNEFGDLEESPMIKAMNEGYNVIITPHVGGMTREGQLKAYTYALKKLEK